MTRSVLVYGAGAIGRGFLPWVFPETSFEISYVESDPALRSALQRCQQFTTYVTREGKYHPRRVAVQEVFALGEELNRIGDFDAIVTAVGPRNFTSLESSLARTDAPVICLENDASLPAAMRERTGRQNIYFGIPDVISSRTAPKVLLQDDPLAIVSEDGVCFVEAEAASVGGDIHYVDEVELQRQWCAKLYIHNTPHCVAAYLGSLACLDYLHESMADPRISEIVSGAMNEMTRTVVARFRLDEAFSRWYRDKEVARFSNPLLFDPIARVAREPFRKLGLKNRLIGAAQLALSRGIVPENLLLGIMAAFCYENSEDEDRHLSCLREALPPEDFLEIIIGLRPSEALYDLLIERWNDNSLRLKEIRNA